MKHFPNIGNAAFISPPSIIHMLWPQYIWASSQRLESFYFHHNNAERRKQKGDFTQLSYVYLRRSISFPFLLLQCLLLQSCQWPYSILHPLEEGCPSCCLEPQLFLDLELIPIHTTLATSGTKTLFFQISLHSCILAFSFNTSSVLHLHKHVQVSHTLQ